MFSYVLSSASAYFVLPVDDDQEDSAISSSSKHITWVPSDSSDSLDYVNPSTPSKSPSISSQRSKATIQEILAQNDLYRVLGIQRTSRIDKASLRRAYLSRSKACHPDKFPDDPEATRAFQKVSVAYDVLSKPSSKRLYDSRPPHSCFNFFANQSYPPPEETFRNVVVGVFNDLLDGDLDIIRSLLRAVNDMNPSLRLGEEGINSVLVTLQSIRDRALTCRTCILALHTELTRLLEVQRAFHDLSYFDLRRRSCLAIRLARLTVSLPIAVEQAIMKQQLDDTYDADRRTDGDGDRMAIMNQRIYTLLHGLVRVLERMECILK